MAAYAYNGKSIIIAGSVVIPVHAKLWKHYTQPSDRWFGILVSDDPRVDLRPLQESDELTLRLSDGNEGSFTVDWASANPAAGPLRIKGLRQPPF
ncbi:hypothetical protein [Streptomyces sp. NPDC007205]|uniref:hypothetical protein n=1 Tax=Streptomyces sp. NPDC007205 TaxID=3154316 RepID=UPI0033E97C88